MTEAAQGKWGSHLNKAPSLLLTPSWEEVWFWSRPCCASLRLSWCSLQICRSWTRGLLVFCWFFFPPNTFQNPSQLLQLLPFSKAVSNHVEVLWLFVAVSLLTTNFITLQGYFSNNVILSGSHKRHHLLSPLVYSSILPPKHIFPSLQQSKGGCVSPTWVYQC